ncbi:histidine phosphatase family protein [Brevibacillus ruminantium]|uniref:Histidine phosphatase family protein n=1 Tax=Brevibacillus ruminantium TaxID=2950604 RepID=A0ABY4WCA7_9BACL|nr:histidine phosphatase family protein [Brevibacillus ruminantium]USG64539.1 histidine phosphatase family protein [Brevibacillus ruminantium]
MRWIWIRHGETEENRQRRYHGHTDAPLNQAGMEQARKLSNLLACEKPDLFYTSDLLRSRQTAEGLSAAWGIAPTPVPELRELSFGDWEQLTYEELMSLAGERARQWYDDPFQYAPPGGETVAQLGSRVDRLIKGVLRKLSDRAEERNSADQEWSKGRHQRQGRKPEQTVVLVTHGGAIRWFQAAWMHGNPQLYWQMTGLGHGQAMIVRQTADGWRLVTDSGRSDFGEESET